MEAAVKKRPFRSCVPANRKVGGDFLLAKRKDPATTSRGADSNRPEFGNWIIPTLLPRSTLGRRVAGNLFICRRLHWFTHFGHGVIFLSVVHLSLPFR